MSKKKREVIKLTEEQLLAICDEYGDIEFQEYGVEDYSLIEEETVRFDSEKCFEKKRVIIRRISDNKFFEGKIFRGSQGNDWSNKPNLSEVFPKEVKKTIYE